jgi:hypothetical protein
MDGCGGVRSGRYELETGDSERRFKLYKAPWQWWTGSVGFVQRDWRMWNCLGRQGRSRCQVRYAGAAPAAWAMWWRDLGVVRARLANFGSHGKEAMTTLFLPPHSFAIPAQPIRLALLYRLGCVV